VWILSTWWTYLQIGWAYFRMMWDYFRERKIKNIPTPLFEQPLKFIAYGIILRDYGIVIVIFNLLMHYFNIG